MPAGLGFRITFGIGAGALLGSLVLGLALQWAASGAPPPLMVHPLASQRIDPGTAGSPAQVAAYRMFAAIQPRDAEAQLQLGTVLANAGDQEGAIRVLEGVLSLHPVPVAVHPRLAILYANAGRTAEARAQALAGLERGARVPPRLLRRLGLERKDG